jgi:IS605 OrfB family transposase
MQLVERHIIDKNHAFYGECNHLCFLSKNLFNYANYLIRQSFILEGKYLNYNTIQKLCQAHVDYQALPAKVSQQTLMRLHSSWISFFEACKQYGKQSEKFLRRPKLPQYKHKTDGRFVVTYTSQAVSQKWLKKGVVYLSGTNIFFTTQVKKIQQVRIVPRLGYYVIEVVHEVEPKEGQFIDGTIAGIDIGLNNLAAVTSNMKGFNPLIVNGKPLKSINAYYNKKKAKLQAQLKGEKPTSNRIKQLSHKRKCKVDNYLHNASRFIINHLAANQIRTLVIGKNHSWKQEINIGKRNNQNFVSIPHTRFIEMLAYKAELAGIKVAITSESYTSKCSFLDREPICKHEKYKGRRIKRGLFRASDGRLINADVNGSLNIIRKAFGNEAFASDSIQGVVVSPVRVTPYKQAV